MGIEGFGGETEAMGREIRQAAADGRPLRSRRNAASSLKLCEMEPEARLVVSTTCEHRSRVSLVQLRLPPPKTDKVSLLRHYYITYPRERERE